MNNVIVPAFISQNLCLLRGFFIFSFSHTLYQASTTDDIHLSLQIASSELSSIHSSRSFLEPLSHNEHLRLRTQVSYQA